MTLRPAQSGHPELAGQPPSALGDNEEAIKHYTQALDMEENSRDRVSRGTVFMDSGDCPRATEDAQAALALIPAHPRVSKPTPRPM